MMKVSICTLIGIECAACESTHACQRARTGGGTLHPNRAGVACENTHACQPARTGGGTLHLNRAGVRQQHCFIMAIVTRVELAAARCFHAASPTVVRTARWVVVARLRRHCGAPSNAVDCTCPIAGNRRVSKPILGVVHFQRGLGYAFDSVSVGSKEVAGSSRWGWCGC